MRQRAIGLALLFVAITTAALDGCSGSTGTSIPPPAPPPPAPPPPPPPPPGPAIGLNGTNLQFSATQGGANPSSQAVAVSNSGGGTLTALALGTISYGGGASGWLQASLSGETAPATLTIQPMTAGLAAGTYTATVPTQSAAASNSPQTVSATFVVTTPPPTIALSPNNAQFSAVRGGSNPQSKPVAITNSGGGTLSGLTVGTPTYGPGGTGWLQATLSGGAAPATLTLQPILGNLSSGTFTATVPIQSSGASNSPAAVTVTLVVTEPPPAIALSSNNLQFTAIEVGTNPVAQAVTITNGGGGTLSGITLGTVSFAPGASGWIQTTLSGSGVPATLTIQPVTSTLPAGTYTASIPIQSSVASNTPLTLSITFTVTSRVVHHAVDPYLASPASGSLWQIPVLIISYLPTVDGINLDVLKTPDFFDAGPMTLNALQTRILDIVRRKKMALEEGSRFHGYRNAAAPPSIGIRVVDHITVYELSPASTKQQNLAGNPYHPDFLQIFQRLDVQRYIDLLGVRQVWFVTSGFDATYPSYNPAIHNPQNFRFYWESNMSSPLTGDVSNSDRDPADLPLYQHTYIVFGINFRRIQAEAIHNVGHQLEHMLSHVAGLQDGNTDLFWKQFVGQDQFGQFITGRTGWTHMPPNTIVPYDYLNPTLVPSDIETWTPAGTGVKTPVNVDTWGRLVYPWPGATDFPQRVESQWYVYWFQNYPGRNNAIAHGTQWLTNWWAFLGDWDAAITAGLGLHGPSPAAGMASAAAPYRFTRGDMTGAPPVCIEPRRAVPFWR